MPIMKCFSTLQLSVEQHKVIVFFSNLAKQREMTSEKNCIIYHKIDPM